MCVHVIQQPGESFPSRLLIVYAAARNPADGRAAFAEFQPRAAVRRTGLSGLGDEAVAVDYAVYVRKGAQVVTLSVMTRQPAASVNPSLRSLAELAAQRAWG